MGPRHPCTPVPRLRQLSLRRSSALARRCGPYLAIVLLSLPQIARAGAPAAAQGASDTAASRAVVIDEDDEVNGELPRPTGDRLSSRSPGRHGSLIRLRVRFNDRLVTLSREMAPG